MKTVNQVFKTYSKFDINKSISIDSKIVHRPRMRIFKENKTSIILFPNGCIRVMGQWSSEFVSKILDEFNIHFTKWELQTKTCLHKLPGKINILQMKIDNPKFLYEPELFCCLSIFRFNVRINVFHTGNCLVFGKTHDERIMSFLNFLYCKYRI